MKLVGWEMKKALTGRLVLLVLAFLTVIVGVVCAIFAQPRQIERETIHNYKWYLENEEEADEYLEELMQMFLEHKNDEGYLFPTTLTTDDSVSDLDLLISTQKKKTTLKSFQSSIEKIVRGAENRVAELQYFSPSNSQYLVRYFTKRSEIYSVIAQQPVSERTFAYGYEKYFINPVIPCAAVLFAVVLSSAIMLHDKTSGMEMILHAAKKGKWQTSIAKSITILVGTTLSTLIIHITGLMITGLSYGFSSLRYPIQALPGFEKTPFAWSIGEYLWMHFLLRLTGILCVAIVSAVLACLFRKHVFVFVSSFAFASINLALFLWNSPVKSSVLQTFNLAALVETTKITQELHLISVFGMPVRLPIILCLASGAMIVGGICLCASVYGKCRPSPQSARDGRQLSISSRVIEYFRCQTRSATARNRSVRICTYEFQKMRLHMTTLAALVLMVGQLVVIAWSVSGQHSYHEAKYYQYIKELRMIDGPESRAEQVEQDLSTATDRLRRYDEMSERYTNGEISSDEYNEYLKIYNQASRDYPVFERAKTYLLYLSRQSEKTGKDIKPSYTKGIDTLFTIDSGYLFALILILIAHNSYTVEFKSVTGSSAMALILKCAKLGKGATYAAKIFVCGSLGTAVCLLFQISKYAIVSSAITFPDLKDSLWVSSLFENVTLDISLGWWMVICLMSQAIIAFMITGLLCALSFFEKRTITALTVDCILLYLPEIAYLSLFDNAPVISLFTCFNLRRVLTGTEVSSRQEIFGGGIAYLLTVIVLIVLFLLFTGRVIEQYSKGQTPKRTPGKRQGTSRNDLKSSK